LPVNTVPDDCFVVFCKDVESNFQNAITPGIDAGTGPVTTRKNDRKQFSGALTAAAFSTPPMLILNEETLYMNRICGRILPVERHPCRANDVEQGSNSMWIFNVIQARLDVSRLGIETAGEWISWRPMSHPRAFQFGFYPMHIVKYFTSVAWPWRSLRSR